MLTPEAIRQILEEFELVDRYGHLGGAELVRQLVSDLEQERCKVRTYRERTLRLEHVLAKLHEMLELARET